MTLRAILNLVMITALAYGARSFVPAGQTITGSGAALAFGFLLIAAMQIGFLTDRARLTSITGYLVCGIVFGPEVLGIVSHAMLADLALVKGTAVALIALLAGSELNFRSLRPSLRAITSISLASMSAAAAGLWLLFFAIASWLPITSSYSITGRAAVALICANVLAAFSPAVVIGVISDTKASGPLTRLCMSIVVVADLVMVVSFALTSTIVHNVFPAPEASGGMSALVQHIFGSIVVGAIVGSALAFYMRRVKTRTGLVVFALLFIVAEGGRVLHLDPLLVGLTAGLLIENASPVSGEEIAHSAQPLALPMFAIFFSVVGAEIQLRAFAHVAIFAVAAAAVRAIGLFLGARGGARIGKVPPEIGRLVPYGLLPQAGVAIALSVLVLNGFPPWGSVVGTILLGSLVVNQLAGPILFRYALARAGEIPQAEDLTEGVAVEG